MNRITMVIWGLTICLMFFLILVIGYKQRDEVFLNLASDLKKVSTEYVEDKKINVKFGESTVVFISDLIEDKYIKEDENIKKYCIKSVVLSRGIFKYNYQIVTDCNEE